jgi:hypothetical protein
MDQESLGLSKAIAFKLEVILDIKKAVALLLSEILIIFF